MQMRGWRELDFLYVVGEAYVDHPSFGHAIISRVLEKHGYKDAFDKMVRFFASDPNAKVVVTGMFWRDTYLEEAMRSVADENGYCFVKIDDLGDDDSMKALGLFEHHGVAIHPGDLGMKNIADRIMSAARGIL